ncbi:N-acetylmuramoyl-L-alanine amidase [Curvibacter gracilis]|uniref:N-acetylmuramoyl-L-alanine amidase n=1 Tax=Curvibacter gracilis TaxID=230310 RepID=UPI000A03928E
MDLLEQAKDAKERYPTNHDSIGIELVGAPVQDVYLAPPPAQNDAAQWLLHELLDTFLLKIDRVCTHGFISPHKNQTEAGLFNYFPHN